MSGPYNKSTTVVCLTPPELINALGKFDLDPCAYKKQPWKLARREYRLPQDGLALPWRGRVWCNPPYGPDNARWVKRCAESGNAVMLINAWIARMWFDEVWETADAMLLITGGRLLFYRPLEEMRRSNPMAESVLIAWGENNVGALRALDVKGILITRWKIKRGRSARSFG